MNSLIAAAKVFAHDEDGITAIEYGLIAATMATAIIAVFSLLNTGLTTAFTTLATRITSA